MSSTLERKVRSDKKVDCYPSLNVELIKQLVLLASETGQTKTAFASHVAHYCLWNHAVLDQLQPYFQHIVALTWDTNEYSNCFHAWVPDLRWFRDIRPVIDEELVQDRERFKFRISQEDRRRLQVLAYALNITKLDGLWPVLFPLVLLDGRSLWNLTQHREIVFHGFHPLKQEWIEAKSWDNHREAVL